MKYNYFIKEYKYITKVNALGEPLEYNTSYVICRTLVWVWLAKLIPSLLGPMLIQYLWIADDIKEAIAKMNNSESVEIDWVSWVPSSERFRFRYLDQAEDFLKRIKSFPNQFYINVYQRD